MLGHGEEMGGVGVMGDGAREGRTLAAVAAPRPFQIVTTSRSAPSMSTSEMAYTENCD